MASAQHGRLGGDVVADGLPGAAFDGAELVARRVGRRDGDVRRRVVHRADEEAADRQLLGEIGGALVRPAEDDRRNLALAARAELPGEDLELLPLRHEHVSDPSLHRAGRLWHRRLGRIAERPLHPALDEILDRVGNGRREHHPLCIARHEVEQLVHGIPLPQLQDAGSAIDHHRLHLVQLERRAAHRGHHVLGGGDQDLRLGYRRAPRSAHRREVEADGLGEREDGERRSIRRLERGDEHEKAERNRVGVGRGGLEPVQHAERVGHRLPRAGRRARHDVPAAPEGGDHRLLKAGGAGEIFVLQKLDELLTEPKVFESRHFRLWPDERSRS